MTGIDKKVSAAAVSRVIASGPQSDGPRLTFDEAATEIAHALGIKYEAAAMTLYGLCATGNVRWADIQGVIVDEDTCTIADFTRDGRPVHVTAADVRHYLTDWSAQPQRSKRDEVIRTLFAEGLIPPRRISWKAFYRRVRDDCNGWVNGRPALGFGDKQIQRLVKELRAE
jgi:hypothetical protein